MKSSIVSKLVGAGVLAASLAIVPATLPGAAQTSPTAPGTTDAPAARADVDRDNDIDWGWLGLLGLIGLAGLNKKPARTTTAYRDPNEVGTGSRY